MGRPGLTHEDRMKMKRENYCQETKKNVMAVTAHAVLSFSGFLAAGMAYQYFAVQIAWLSCVLLSCVEAGYQFYIKSYDEEHAGNTIKRGFAKMALSWCVMLAVY